MRNSYCTLVAHILVLQMFNRSQHNAVPCLVHTHPSQHQLQVSLHWQCLQRPPPFPSTLVSAPSSFLPGGRQYTSSALTFQSFMRHRRSPSPTFPPLLRFLSKFGYSSSSRFVFCINIFFLPLRENFLSPLKTPRALILHHLPSRSRLGSSSTVCCDVVRGRRPAVAACPRCPSVELLSRLRQSRFCSGS